MALAVYINTSSKINTYYSAMELHIIEVSYLGLI